MRLPSEVSPERGESFKVHYTSKCTYYTSCHTNYIYLPDNKVAANAVFATDGAATDPNE